MRGWILDLYPDYKRDEIVIWVKKEGGGVKRLADAFSPSFYVSAENRDINELVKGLAFSPLICGVMLETNQRTVEGKLPRNLLRIEVPRYAHLTRLARKINEEGDFSRFKLYNADINIGLRYIFGKRIPPMTLLEIKKTANGLKYKSLEDPGSLCYEQPILKEATFKLNVKRIGGFISAAGRIEEMAILCEEDELVFEGDEAEIMTGFSNALKELDPDVLYSGERGSEELSYLYQRARDNNLDKEFWLGREPSRIEVTQGRTYHTYGRVVYKPPAYALSGRVYIDRGAFLYSESGVHGLVDLSRFSGIPLQQLSRMSPGNAITTMQLRHAVVNNILVPWKRQNPEHFKTAWKLLYSDRGGYIFDPKVGVFEGAIELDFSSMYPNIMVKFNVSPETVLCSCCKSSSHRVPVLNYHICERRTGLVPQVLKPVIERRVAYKKLMMSSENGLAEMYRERQAILKWLLITSFGYQGYRNARFGRIEGHETICAYGRELLLRAKEVVEHFDFEVIHGLVDSLWIKGRASIEDLQGLCELITAEVGIDINVEGRYKWIVFLPNRSTQVGALNRYYGVFEDGTLKVRGIELRMKNTPGFIRSFQRDALEVMARARSIQELREELDSVFDVMRGYSEMLATGCINPAELVFKVTVSKGPADYKVNNFTHAALKRLRKWGVSIQPGQSVRYIVTDQRLGKSAGRVKLAEEFEEGDRYDLDFYTSHVVRAAESLLMPFGYTKERLKDVLIDKSQSTLADYY